LKNGRAFIGLDILGDTKGFSFTTENGAETKTMGDEISLLTTQIKVSRAAKRAFRLFSKTARNPRISEHGAN
jgi:hypothetical protein